MKFHEISLREISVGDFLQPIAEGGGGTTGGIKKGKRTRGKRKGTGHRQWLAARGADLRPAADEASGS